MSTILDAIRKAEKQRSEDAVPSLEAMVQQSRSGRRRNSSGWVVWLALIVVLAAAGYLYKGQLKGWGSSVVNYGQGLIDRSGLDTGKIRDKLLAKQFQMQPVLQESAVSTAASTAVDAAGNRLTAAQRQLLDALHFDVISWSQDADKRFVMMGSRTYREGDELEGFPLQRIEADGLVLNVGGEEVRLRP